MERAPYILRCLPLAHHAITVSTAGIVPQTRRCSRQPLLVGAPLDTEGMRRIGLVLAVVHPIAIGDKTGRVKAGCRRKEIERVRGV